MARQIRPRPKVAMKLMASGVTFSAATMRSPSFSRSSSSTMMTMRPSWISTMASSIVANCIRLDQILHILCQNIELDVYRVTRPGGLEVCILECVWNYCDRKSVGTLEGRDCQADAIHGDRTFLHDITRAGLRIFHFEFPGVALAVELADVTDAVHVALHDVSAEPRIAPHRAFEIHDGAFAKISEARSIERFARHVGGEGRSITGPRRQANAVHGNT